MTPSEANTQQLSGLLPQLTDLLALPRDIDLPVLYSVECRRADGDPGWTIRGHLFQFGDDRAWADLSAWAYNAVGQISLSEEYGPEADRARKASVTVVVGDISVEIWAAVSAAFIPPNTCCVASYQLGDACAECKTPAPRVSHMMQFTGSGRDTGHAICGAADGGITHDDAEVSCPDCLEGADEQYDDARHVAEPIDSTYSDPAVRAAISGGAQ